VNRRAPVANLHGGFFFRDSVTFLDFAGELVLLAGDDVEIVVGELAPFLFDETLHLLHIPSIWSQFIVISLSSVGAPS